MHPFQPIQPQQPIREIFDDENIYNELRGH